MKRNETTHLNFFKRLAGRLREHEEGMNGHAKAENAKDQICFPLDVDERRRCEVPESEVEDPVRSSCDRDCLASYP